ncbi:MAG: S8 family serine peptidase [Candidatus Deferrimicrobiaceae bacterium]
MTRPKGTHLYFNPRPRHFLLLVGILFGMASLSGVDVAPDRRKIDPAILFRSAPGAISAPQSIPAQEEPPVSVLIRLAADDDALPDQIRNLGGTARKIFPRIYAARLPTDATRYLSHRPAILYMEPDRVVWPLLDVSRPAVSADIVQQGSPPLPQSFRGDNTYVGIVDTGLSGTHPDFAGRIAHTFSVLGLDPLKDTNGHGTHVAGIAAGDGTASAGTYTGMAPGARLLIGRAGADSFQTSAIIAAISDFLLFAGPTPVSINLSLGVFLGPHDGTSSFESTVNSLATGTAGSKQIITVAAGNERNFNEHFHTTWPPFGIVNKIVEFASGTHFADVEIWADGEDEYSVTATMGSESITFLSGTAGTSPSGRIAIGNKSSNPPNGDTLIFLTFQPPPGTGTASIRLTRTRNGGTGTVDGYIDRSEGTFTAAVSTGTITEPANAENVIAVGSFNTKQYPSGQPDTMNGISAFSSLGPTRDGRIKPDIAAPGFVIYSTRSLEAPEANYSFGVIDNNYAIEAGTSMSAPHVAGIAALVWESNPALTGAQMRERLKRTADLQTAVPDTTWGHGKVNALSAITETVAGISGPARTLPGQNLTLRADEKSSGPYGTAATYSWSASGATVTPTGPTTTFTANTPGDYPVTLNASPGSAPYNQASVTIRVNNVPTASISGPAAVDNVTSIPITGTGLDADGQPLSFHWILLARPSTSSSVLTTANVDNVSLVPDRSGTYEVGLRVNDGLDDSALATHTVTVALVTGSSDGGGGGGGCAIGSRNSKEDGASSADALLLLLSPLGVLWARKRGYRFPRQCLCRSSRRR